MKTNRDRASRSNQADERVPSGSPSPISRGVAKGGLSGGGRVAQGRGRGGR